MLKWEDVTSTFDEESRHWNGRYLELCEVAENKIELNLFSCEDDDWEIYVNYGIMYGISYAKAEEAVNQRNQMKKELEEEYEKHKDKPSDEFIDAFVVKYGLDVLNAFF